MRWLGSQPGRHFVVANRGAHWTDTRLLALTRRTRAISYHELETSEIPDGRAAILAAWPDETALETLSTGAGIVSPSLPICVMAWGQSAWLNTWLQAHSAKPLRLSGPRPKKSTHRLPGRARLALENVTRAFVGFSESEMAAAATEALQELAQAGRPAAPAAVWAWALATGHRPASARLLRDSAQLALDASRVIPIEKAGAYPRREVG